MSPVTMADLTPGTRIRHIDSGTTGSIGTENGSTWIKWEDGPLAASPVGRAWPVRLDEIEIIGEAAP